jgi:gliding motility-associated-like protein
LKEVVLVATNIQAESDGFTCSSRAAKTIEILLPPLIAAFRVNPLASCFPVTIEVTENTSTGDVFKWQVIDQSGNIAATALTTMPQFRIVNPGTYDIFLEASSSITGQTAFSQVNGVEVFDLPLASLEARPTTLFVPDTELITFNFSTGANFYEWDFDDGTTSVEFEPSHFYNLEGTYNITLVAGFDHGDRDVDGDGLMDGTVVCYDTATRQVIAREGGLTKVPNAFTPNKGGSSGGVAGSGTFNDVFLPITKGVANEEGAFIMQIFDRWGTLVFESRSQKIGWDGYDRRGNLVPAGVYVYKLDLRLADGQRTTQVGDVTVIR